MATQSENIKDQLLSLKGGGFEVQFQLVDV